MKWLESATKKFMSLGRRPHSRAPAAKILPSEGTYASLKEELLSGYSYSTLWIFCLNKQFEEELKKKT